MMTKMMTNELDILLELGIMTIGRGAINHNRGATNEGRRTNIMDKVKTLVGKD